MNIKNVLFTLGLSVFITGCMSPYVPLALTSSHPASTDAKEAQMYQASATLDIQQKSESTGDSKKKNRTPELHDMKSMKDMGVMNHASH